MPGNNIFHFVVEKTKPFSVGDTVGFTDEMM